MVVVRLSRVGEPVRLALTTSNVPRARRYGDRTADGLSGDLRGARSGRRVRAAETAIASQETCRLICGVVSDTCQARAWHVPGTKRHLTRSSSARVASGNGIGL